MILKTTSTGPPPQRTIRQNFSHFGGLLFLSALLILTPLNDGLLALEAAVYDQTILVKFDFDASELNSLHEQKLTLLSENNPYANEVICTGVRVSSSTQHEAIRIKKRALEACEFARRINPSAEVRVQSKVTSHSRYRGSVIIVMKSPAFSPASRGYVQSEPIQIDMISSHRSGDTCLSDYGWPVLGLDSTGYPVFLKCVQQIFEPDESMPSIDRTTMQPRFPVSRRYETLFSYSPHLYIEPQFVDVDENLDNSDGGSQDRSLCKIAAGDDGAPSFSFGFPLPLGTPVLSSGLTVIVLPVSFIDFPANSSPASDMSDALIAVTNFFGRIGDVPSIEWSIQDHYRLLPRTLESFGLSYEFDPTFQTDFWEGYHPYIQYVIDEFDDEVDFSQFDIVIVEEPRAVPDSLHGMSIPYVSYGNSGSSIFTSDDGEVSSILITGNDEVRDIPNWIHQFGHLLGLPDRNWSSGATPAFDIMWGWYGAPEMAVWNRWLLGAIDDDQVFCKTDDEPEQFLIQPLAWGGDHNLGLVVPLSDERVVVAEARRRQGYDVLLGAESEGLYVYEIDATASIYADDGSVPVDVVAPPRSQSRGMWSFDAPLKVGEVVNIDGWCIGVLNSGSFGELVDVRRCEV